jgi:transporter family-2 protein
MMRYLLLVLVAVAGCGIPIQLASNNRLDNAVHSPALSVTLAFVIGSVVLALLTVSGVLGRGSISGATTAPWWGWMGGILSALAVVVSIIALPRAGAGAVMAATVFGQLTTAMVLDHFGWLDVPRIPISVGRVIGVVLLLVGALLMRSK